MMNEPRRVRSDGDNETDGLMALISHMSGDKHPIERLEAQGQRRLVSSAQLPVDGTERPDEAAKWAAIGVVLGEKTDELFRNVTLPPGWRMKATDHSMWSDLLDDKGRKRAAVFYKAAFYDRRAAVHFVSRYTVEKDYESIDTVIRHRAMEGAVVLFTSSEHPGSPRPEWQDESRIGEAQRAECCAWLDANRPGWSDPAREWGIN